MRVTVVNSERGAALGLAAPDRSDLPEEREQEAKPRRAAGVSGQRALTRTSAEGSRPWRAGLGTHDDAEPANSACGTRVSRRRGCPSPAQLAVTAVPACVDRPVLRHHRQLAVARLGFTQVDAGQWPRQPFNP